MLSPLILNPPLNVTVIRDTKDLYKLQDFFNREKETGFDVETEPKKDYFWRKCRTIQFGKIKEQYVIDLLPFCDNDPNVLFNSQGYYGKNIDSRLQPVFDVIKPALCSDAWTKIGVNLAYEYLTMYWNFGLRTFGFYDCMVVEKCIWAGAHSLKDYGFFSMAEMGARYFNVEIEKSLQESFTIDKVLSKEQYEYAALDTRFPFALKAAQELVIKGYTKKTHTNPIFGRIDPIVTGDNLEEICQIENDCIGAFVDMHVHGELLDHDRWRQRIVKREEELKTIIEDLDKIFIPLVGDKTNIVTDEQVESAKLKWKNLAKVTDEELLLKKESKKDPRKKAQLLFVETERKVQKEKFKKEASDLSKRRTQINKLVDKCEGNALINYGSGAQLLTVLCTLPNLKNLKDTNDATLEKFEGNKIIDLIRTYREVSKDINTYGLQWITEWKTKPCKDEGWLHPGDHRLHSVFNQQEAETGRSSSEQPNGQNIPKDKNTRACFIADPPDEEFPEGYDLLTIDFSGAELRILAEEANEPVWIEAFSKGQDVHAICAEMVDPEAWYKLALPTCKYFSKNEFGEYNKFKCGCPEHDDLRNGLKSTNFGLPYGIGPRKLSGQIKKSYSDTLDLLDRHKRAFTALWTYLDKSGQLAKTIYKSFDMFGRRRLFKKPTWGTARQKAIEDRGITDPDSKQIGNAFNALEESIGRQGKNHRIQSANATIIKIVMAKLSRILSNYSAKMQKMVHDELVIKIPKRYSQTVANITQEEIKKAAARKMTKVTMTSDYHIADYWQK